MTTPHNPQFPTEHVVCMHLETYAAAAEGISRSCNFSVSISQGLQYNCELLFLLETNNKLLFCGGALFRF